MKEILEKMTEKSREALEQAVFLAGKRGNPEIKPLHLVLKIIEKKEGLIGSVLEKTPDKGALVLKDLQSELERLPRVSGASQAPYPSRDFLELLGEAEKEASQAGDRFISSLSLVLAIFSGKFKDLEGLFKRNALGKNKLQELAKTVKKGGGMEEASSENNLEALQKYTKDLSCLARQGKLDPVIGRDKELRRVIQVLTRRTKNNPVLIGEPGVGKTAIAEGLALRILNKDVPELLFDKKVLALDLASMLAGAKYRGDFEDRLKSLIKEVIASEGEIILFIDELHTLVGAGKLDGAMDAGQMLKPALARGELRVIGATTLNEYKKFIEKDKALERRFQTVLVDEPSPEEALTMLRGLKNRYEDHHGVRIQDQALKSAVHLSHRYISDRFLPDKAIDLIDEAASRLNIEIHSVPSYMDEIHRKILELQIEQKALLKEKDDESKKRLKIVKSELKDLEKKKKSLSEKLEKEKSKIVEIRNLKKQINELELELGEAEREGFLDKAAKLKHGELPALKSELREKEKDKNNLKTEENLLTEEVGPEEVAQVVAQWTGIPVHKMLQTEATRLLNMEESLRKRVLGQDKALSLISDAIRRSRAEISEPNCPVGSFIFLGPTGVGKTETAKALSEFLFDSEKSLIRLDMSEYMEKHSVARLIGAPPGYVGFEEGGQLTEKVRRQPYSVILIDEIEKAHPDIFNVLLQVLDDGRLTDGQGRTVDFRNSILIMTSNLGSDILISDKLKPDEKRKKVLEVLKSHFRPEFLNRIDETVIYNSIDEKQIEDIVKIQVERVGKRLKTKKRIEVRS